MKIRAFEEKDLLSLSQLFLLTKIESWWWLESAKWQLSDFEKLTQGEIILVAENNEQYLGFASIYLQENFLHHLFITPNFQSQGVGSALLQASERLFTGTGYLKCLSNNKHALSFYLRHDWKVINTGESEDGDYVLMSKASTITL